MPRIISEKKKAESSDGKQGRTKHQKLKSYIVTQYLLKNTDEDHLASAKDIIDYLVVQFRQVVLYLRYRNVINEPLAEPL